ncbi:MAG: hypothetical protein NXY57DRAFT_961563 [Lentinula lateritia]|uniref:Uncharacterized protein n=1 Tax=Lentinula lateritia TaxID=40482 RepID=A0ABQ8VH96_9AGAR|nr:MAG: hypothetical protein NXY57DRAFT_961563 [Lentinula lateritia]KAJ4494304.1 hypothetical protein C8R41DRAFT_919273 [Lentinula lateritia]
MAFSSTLIIVIIIIAVVILLASLLVSYILWSKSKRKVPLPPVQPLAHDRERSFHALAAEKERERSMFLQIQIAPSWSELGTLKSAVSSESSCTANTATYPVPPGISSRNRHAPPRPLSLASSVHTSRSNLSRAIPHAPNSNVQIVLPVPLGSSTVDYSRNSVADGWASHVVNDSTRSRSRPRAQSLSKSHSRSSSNRSYDYSRPNPSPPDMSARHRARTNSLPYSTTSSNQVLSVPPMPSQYPSSMGLILPPPVPPPVPRIPSVYGQLKSTATVSTSSDPDLDGAEFPPRRRSRSRGPTHNQSFHNSDWVQEDLASQVDRRTGRPRERSRNRGRH